MNRQLLEPNSPSLTSSLAIVIEMGHSHVRTRSERESCADLINVSAENTIVFILQGGRQTDTYICVYI